MKLIIDVAEKYYEACKDAVEESYPSQIEEVIANGVPYNPSGEWIVIHNALGETKYQCNQCQHYVNPSDDKNFCPNCGAQMKIGGEEE